jgi:hypothetical protein
LLGGSFGVHQRPFLPDAGNSCLVGFTCHGSGSRSTPAVRPISGCPYQKLHRTRNRSDRVESPSTDWVCDLQINMREDISSTTLRSQRLFNWALADLAIHRTRFVPGLLLVLLVFTPLTASSRQIQGVPDLSGNWIRSDFAGLGQSAQLNDEIMTIEGQRQWDAYDFLTDDPAYGCVAASWARIWSNPNVVVQISQSDEFVRLRHEWMDIDRRLPLVDPEVADPERVYMEGLPTLGRSIAWYDGEALVIDTSDYSPGYVSTIANLAGLPQSRTMHTVERIRRQGEGLEIEITHLDPTIFREPFVMTIGYAATDFELLEYGCSPDDASIVAPK